MKGQIYIAGPMRGIDHLNFEEFFVAARQLRMAGWEPWNPAAHDVDEWWAGNKFDINTGLLFDIQRVNESKAIYMLDGWEKSDGARCEYYYAQFIGIEILYQTPLVAEDEDDEDDPEDILGLRCINSSCSDWWTQDKVYPLIPSSVAGQLVVKDDDGDERYDLRDYLIGEDGKNGEGLTFTPVYKLPEVLEVTDEA